MLSAVQLPIGRVALITDADSAMRSAQQIGYPIVLKPVAGSKGDNVFAGLRNAEELQQALATAPLKRRQFLLQSFFPGDDHRLPAVSGRLIAAARRHPASVIGDGRRTIGQLVEEANKDPRRGRGFAKIMNRIEIDGEALRVLSRQGFALENIPAEGATVRLRATANIATGGTAVDVTEAVHPDNAEAAIKAAKALGLQVAGVDLLSPDISRSWREIRGRDLRGEFRRRPAAALARQPQAPCGRANSGNGLSAGRERSNPNSDYRYEGRVDHRVDALRHSG